MSFARKVVWAAIGTKPSETTYERLEQPEPQIGFTLIELVPRDEVPQVWAEKLWPAS